MNLCSGLLPLRGYCQALKDSTPYFPFQSLLEELFEVTFMPTAAARQSIVDQVTDKWPHLLERLGLLNAVLPFHFDETMKVSVYPVQRWYSFKRQTSRRMQERRVRQWPKQPPPDNRPGMAPVAASTSGDEAKNSWKVRCEKPPSTRGRRRRRPPG